MRTRSATLLRSAALALALGTTAAYAAGAVTPSAVAGIAAPTACAAMLADASATVTVHDDDRVFALARVDGAVYVVSSSEDRCAEVRIRDGDTSDDPVTADDLADLGVPLPDAARLLRHLVAAQPVPAIS